MSATFGEGAHQDCIWAGRKEKSASKTHRWKEFSNARMRLCPMYDQYPTSAAEAILKVWSCGTFGKPIERRGKTIETLSYLRNFHLNLLSHLWKVDS